MVRTGTDAKNLLLADHWICKYFAALKKNRFLLTKCITIGAFTFPTPFLVYFFLVGVDPGEISSANRFLLIMLLLLGGALIGLASFYKDSAIAALKDWSPSRRSGD